MLEGLSSVPRCCRLGRMKISSIIFPPCRGRMKLQGPAMFSNEKSMIMGSPVTDPDGNVFLFGILWKPKTPKSL